MCVLNIQIFYGYLKALTCKKKKKKKEAPSHSYLLTSSPSDGNHNKKAVLVFAVSLSHPSKDLPRPRHFLHPWQHQSEGQRRCTCIHQVHGAVKHQVPNRDTQGSFNMWTHAHFNDMATKQGSRWFWQHYPQVFVKYLHSPAGGVVNCLWDRCNNTSHQQRGPKTYLDTYTLWKRLYFFHIWKTWIMTLFIYYSLIQTPLPLSLLQSTHLIFQL